MQSRVLEDSPSLRVDMKDVELKAAFERAASFLTTRHQEELLARLVDTARSGGRACLGRAETERALHGMRVETLLLSRSLIEIEADFADACEPPLRRARPWRSCPGRVQLGSTVTVRE